MTAALAGQARRDHFRHDPLRAYADPDSTPTPTPTRRRRHRLSLAVRNTQAVAIEELSVAEPERVEDADPKWEAVRTGHRRWSFTGGGNPGGGTGGGGPWRAWRGGTMARVTTTGDSLPPWRRARTIRSSGCYHHHRWSDGSATRAAANRSWWNPVRIVL